jgi:hypothetical protein
MPSINPRGILKRFISKFPRMLALMRKYRFEAWKFKVRIRGKQFLSGHDPNRTYWIDPKKIELSCVLPTYEKYGERGKVIGGNWDRERIPFTELDSYRAIEDRFVGGKTWKETDFYHRILEEISSGIVKWGCRNREDLDRRCAYLDAVFEDMKTNGYRSQEDLMRNGEYIRAPFRAHEESSLIKIEDEITVRIGHDGVILFEDGRHRLAMAKVLGIDSIPVKVTVRHADWIQFRKEVIEYARSQNGKLYAPITHMDLTNMPSNFDDERFELLMANLDLIQGTVLDIGSHWGYFCHRFEEVGFDCYAVENAAIHVHFLERLKRAENRKFKIIHGDIFDLHEKVDFDIVLALNIFHHFLKSQSTYEQLQQLLQRLDMKVMFFQAHNPDEAQMTEAYRNFDGDEFSAFILENSCLDEAHPIGRGEDGRVIYKLVKVQE